MRNKVTEKDVNIYKELEGIELSKAKRKIKTRLIYGAASLVCVVVIASLFIPASQVDVIIKVIDTFFKYIPFVG